MLRAWEQTARGQNLEREMDRLFGSFWGGALATKPGPAVNLWEENDSLVAQVEVPGFLLSDLDVSILGNRLTLTGNQKQEVEEVTEGTKLIRRERGSTSFDRTLSLPCRVKAKKIRARLESGILTVTLPKADEEKPLRIEVKPS